MKHALVTGASSGIGAALARRLAARGYQVHLAARRKGDLEKLAQEIEKEGGAARSFVLDVSRPEAAEAHVRDLDRDVGGLSLVVANAGIGGAQVPGHKETLENVRRVFETNFFGVLATVLPVLPGMIARREGHVAVVSSLAAEIHLPAAVDYGTSKAAISFFFESLLADAKQHGVDVTVIHPGFVKTPLTDKNDFAMPFIVDVEKAARIIDAGLARKKALVRFPFALGASITAGRALPRSVRNALMNRNRPDRARTLATKGS